MRASGRPPHSHRDPARPVRGGDRSGLSLGALAHRLMLRPELWVQRISPDDVVRQALETVPTPAAEDVAPRVS